MVALGLTAVLLGLGLGQVWARCDEWNSLEYVDYDVSVNSKLWFDTSVSCSGAGYNIATSLEITHVQFSVCATDYNYWTGASSFGVYTQAFEDCAVSTILRNQTCKPVALDPEKTNPKALRGQRLWSHRSLVVKWDLAARWQLR